MVVEMKERIRGWWFYIPLCCHPKTNAGRWLCIYIILVHICLSIASESSLSCASTSWNSILMMAGLSDVREYNRSATQAKVFYLRVASPLGVLTV